MDPVSQTSGPPDMAPAPAPHGMEKRIFVLFSIAVVAVMFVGMVTLLYWRERPAPSALLVLRVPASQDGVIATINSARDISPIVTTLQGNQEVRIPLPPGEYTVTIDLKNRTPLRARFTLTDYYYFPIVLDDQPATLPASLSKTKP